jgi:hypothetical protein
MGDNTTLNALLALMEGRPELARAFLRSPSSNIGDANALQMRVYRAMEILKCQAVKSALREILRSTSRIIDVSEDTQQTKDAYLQGISDVEEILAKAIFKAEEVERDLCK